MSKGLEDFKELKKTTCFYCQYHINEECVNDKCIWNNVEKELKALEIIIRTRLNVGTFLLLCKGNNEFSSNTTYEQYCYFCDKEKMHQFPCYKMTKEEYELVLGVCYGKENISDY